MTPATQTKETTETRTDRRKARTATAILDAAERLFLGQGFAMTTMDDLSEEADVAIGSIYSHFGSKDGVYAALIDRALELDRRYSEEGFQFGTNALERLAGLAEGYLRFAREHPGYFRLFRFPPPDRPSADDAPQPAARVADRIREETKRMADLLREGMKEGTVRKVDPGPTAAYLWASWDGVIAAHLGPANMSLTDSQFEDMLNAARLNTIRGLLTDKLLNDKRSKR